MYFLTWWFLELPYCDGKMWLVLFMALFDKGALFLLAFTFRWCALALSPRRCVVTLVWTTWLRLPGPSSRTQLRSTRCSLTSIGLISITYRSASTAVCVSCAYLLLYISVFKHWTDIIKQQIAHCACLRPPQEQASWVCQCEDRLIQRLEQDFKATLQQQNSLEQWATWLDSVVSQVLKPYEHNPMALPKAAKVFLLNWSFYRWGEMGKKCAL